MRLLLTRHGETVENRDGIHQGHLPGTLTEKGRQQAKKLGLLLSKEKLDVILCSDLARAIDTAREIIAFHPETPVYYLEELRERNKGDFAGKRKLDTKNIPLPLNAETLEQLNERAKYVLSWICNEFKDKTVLIVAHRRINQAMYGVMFNLPLVYLEKNDYQDNAGISAFECIDGKYTTISFNYTGHLL